MTPTECGEVLAGNIGLREAQADCAHDEDVNQTDAVETSNSDDDSSHDNSADYHFTCFIKHTDGCVYELDGYRNRPRKLPGKLLESSNTATSTSSSSTGHVNLSGNLQSESGKLNDSKEQGITFALFCGEFIQKEYLCRASNDPRFATLALARKGVK